MSEYQYYEFQAIDKPLSPEQQAEIRTLSSRVRPTATQAIFTYSFGDFPADPVDVLEEHFDAMLYVANWGSRQLAFRFPRLAVDVDRLNPYYYGVDEISLVETDQHVVLSIGFHEDEEPFGWIEGEGLLSSMISLRGDLMDGDYRSLYLAWLKSAAHAAVYLDGENEAGQETGYETDAKQLVEPPVPPGLRQLTDTLHAFVEFFGIEPDLVAAAAEASPVLEVQDEPLEEWVTRLPEAERNLFLVRLARDEAQVGAELLRRLREVGGRVGVVVPPPASRRTFADLSAAAGQIRQRRERQEREEAERARRRRLEMLAQREPEAWREVGMLIERKTARAYDEAVALLYELRELAEYRGKRARFDARLADIESNYQSRPALLRRLHKAGLA